ncbi:hypothetical protein V6Z11_1Z000300 [Gossypium hirsutum]
MKRRSLPPLAELARPEEKLAGLRIDGKCNTRSRMSFYTGIGIHSLMPDGSLGPETEVRGLPDGAKINFVTWSNDGKQLALVFVLRKRRVVQGKLRVWVADVETGMARPLVDNYVWVDNSTLLVCTIPLSRGDPPKKPLVPSGPKIQSNEQKTIVQVRTFQDLLKDEYDEDLFDYYATSQLVLASLDGKVKEVGSPAIYTSLDPSPDEKFPKKVDLWTADGNFVRELCDLPLAEDIPIASNSVRNGMRSLNWRADKPSTLYWAETQDGGDAKVEVSPRDIVYTQPAEPQEVKSQKSYTNLIFAMGRGISWCDDSLALVYESWYKTRHLRMYSDPGSPMLRRTSTGNYVIAKLRKENDDATYLLLNGNGATPEGDTPFLDLFDINTGSKERIWESDKEKYYESVITDFPHPYPQLASLQKEMIRYERKDGVQLTATLYLPPGYDPSKDGPLPCLVWSYPGEFKSKDAAGQVRGSPNEFAGIGPTSALLWLARRHETILSIFAIYSFLCFLVSSPLICYLIRATIPIIGEGDEEANDRYVEQLVASAEAAVEEVIRRGHTDYNIHDCNLLAHAPHLFCCGIARSGAYNRTLTPFGFQNEDRTLWEATNTYVEMSPFMSANRIKKPILLIHGEEDNNPGTLTMQSDRFFQCPEGHGALCRLMASKHCVSNTSEVSADIGKSKDGEGKEVTDIENKAVAASGGGGAELADDIESGQFHSKPRSLMW